MFLIPVCPQRLGDRSATYGFFHAEGSALGIETRSGADLGGADFGADSDPAGVAASARAVFGAGAFDSTTGSPHGSPSTSSLEACATLGAAPEVCARRPGETKTRPQETMHSNRREVIRTSTHASRPVRSKVEGAMSVG